MKTRLRRALAMIALIAFVVTMLPLSAFAEARTSFIRSRIDSRSARPDSGIEIVPHKTENPKRSAIWDGSIAAGFAGGSGTEDDPYLISNGSELAYLAQQVNSGNRYENVHFKLTNDIYLNDTTDWELWGTTGSSSAGKADTRDGSAIEPTEQNKGDKMDVPIAIPVRPAPKTELESDALSDALNAAGQSNTFVSTGSYPWQVDSTTYDGRTAAQSGNYNVSSSTSSFSTTVTLSAGDIVSFEYCVSSESNYDEFRFYVDGFIELRESGLVSWNSYSYQATADGEYTFMWSYTKDSVVNGNSDACWVDNVYIGAPLAVTGIDVLEQLDIPVNGTGTVAYSVLPENAYNKNVSFESADAGIAAVNANGVVTGVSAGETTITVTTEDGGFTGACTINVYNQAVTGVTIEPSEAELLAGYLMQLTTTVLPENATNKNVIYSVDDESILSVDQNGKVAGLSAGTATVTVTTEDGGFTASAEITVPAQVTGVRISPKSAFIGLGRTIQLTASITPSNAANKNLSWSVSDETIISVDGQGTVTGLSGGTATVTVTTEDGGFSDSAEITVCYAPANTWTVIGRTYYNNFCGVFNGDGYAVRGIYINTQESYQGLFGNSGGDSIIANLGVAESYIYGNKYVGGVVGNNDGTVTNCYNTGNVNGNEHVGGVVGDNDGTVINCYNTGSVNGNKDVGGVNGDNGGTVTDCYNSGNVNGESWVGGVVGSNNSSITGCYNEGSVTGKDYVGGVAGYARNITDCYNIGSVVAGGNYVGGVVGYNISGTISSPVADCYNEGSITGVDYVGGVVGAGNTVITNCYNIGIVNGNERVGGVVGYSKAYNGSTTVANCYNTGSITGSNYVGGVVGDNDEGSVVGGTNIVTTNCYNTGSVAGGDYVGGVVGSGLNITDCHNEGSITGSNYVGGVAGYSRSAYNRSTTVANCYNTGIVNGNERVGGVVGYNEGGTVTDCYNEGSITGKEDGTYVGGVVGYNADEGTVTGCYNEGSVTGEEYVGGVVGLNNGTVTNCYNTGSVTGERRVSGGVVGGVVGLNNGDVTNCYNTGNVTGDEEVGGVIGSNDGIVTDCYNIGSVTGGSYVGGVVGHKEKGIVTNCYYYIDCCASSNSYGTALTNEQMLRAESFEGFDFETVWTMDGNPGYPYPKLINNFQTASPTTDDVVFSIENITAAPGTDVSVAFTVEGEYEAHALTAFVRYDTNMLSVVGNGITQGNIWQNMIGNGGTIVADAVTRPGQVPFMAIMPTNSFSGSGTIFTMNFHVNESVELGTVIPLELEIREFYYMPVQQTSPTLIPFTSVNGSITAQVYHSVTFVDYDGTVLSAQSVAHGSAAAEPTAPEREGYAFIGWDKDFSNVTEDMTVTAQYSTNSYSITYTINGGEYTTQTYEFGAEVSAPEYTVPEGHTFSGWNIPETMPAENLVLDAALTVNEYTVTYNINGEIYAIQVYAYGEEVFAPAYDVPDHFTFSGWDTPATMPAENIVLDAALIEDEKYTVSFMVDGETYFTFTGYEGDAITVPENPEKLGYTFDAWDGMPEDGVLPAANITVTAVWSVNTYTITYTVNGEEYSVRTYEYGAAIITPAYDVPEGYTFSGWDVPETMPAEDLVVDATCTINVYEVTLIDGLNGDHIAVLYVAHGQDAVLPDAPEHAGYIFDRWDGDSTNVTENRTITACYWMNGDVNHDGEITTYDALLIMRYALGLETEGNELIMDFNGDGCVDALDALLVLRRSMV